METRICKKCHVERPLTAFPCHTKNSPSRRWTCQKCRNARLRAWLKAHPEKEQLYSSTYYQKHADEVNARRRNRYAENPEPVKSINNAWAKSNRHKTRIVGHRRRAKEAHAQVNDLTAEQFEEIKAAFQYRCAYCPQTCKICKAKRHKLEPDHVTPLVNGGSNTVHNVVPACKSCNSRKRASPPPTPVQPLLLTVALPKQTKGERSWRRH